MDSIDDLPLIAPFLQTLVGRGPAVRRCRGGAAAADARSLLGGGESRRRHVAHADGRRHQPGRQSDRHDRGAATGRRSGRRSASGRSRSTAQEPPPAAAPTPEQQAADRQALHDSVDFHKIISSLNEHPALLRRLGLVIDLAVPRSATSRTSGTARLVPQWTSAFPGAGSTKTDRPLWIAWRLDPAAALPFAPPHTGCPASSTSERDTASRCTRWRWTRGAADRGHGVRAAAHGERSAPPALRSGGLTLIQEGRSQATHDDLSAAMQDDRGSSTDTALPADDVTRGYRLDVFDVERDALVEPACPPGDYAKDDAPLIEPVVDEGSHHPSATGPAVAAGAEPAADAPIFLHESFVRWDGWSLSAPRPGRSLGVDPSGPDPDRPETMPQHQQRPADRGRAADRDPSCSRAACRGCGSGTVPGAGPDRRSGRQRSRSRGRRRALAAPVGDPAGDGQSVAAGHSWPARRSASPGSNRCRRRRSSSATRSGRARTGSCCAPTPTIPPRPSPSRRVPALRPQGHRRTGRVARQVRRRDRLRRRGSGPGQLRRRGPGERRAAGRRGRRTAVPAGPAGHRRRDRGRPGVAPGNTPAIEWRGTSWDRPRPITLRLAVNDLHFQPPPDIDQDASLITIKLDPALRARSGSAR